MRLRRGGAIANANLPPPQVEDEDPLWTCSEADPTRAAPRRAGHARAPPRILRSGHGRDRASERARRPPHAAPAPAKRVERESRPPSGRSRQSVARWCRPVKDLVVVVRAYMSQIEALKPLHACHRWYGQPATTASEPLASCIVVTTLAGRLLAAASLRLEGVR